MSKISDKTNKLLLNYRNLFWGSACYLDNVYSARSCTRLGGTLWW